MGMKSHISGNKHVMAVTQADNVSTYARLGGGWPADARSEVTWCDRMLVTSD